MNSEHVISEEAMQDIETALANGNNWIAYNEQSYFLEREDVHFLKSKGDAIQFAFENNSAEKVFIVFHASSVADVLKEIPYGKSIENRINQQLENDINMNEKNLKYLQDSLKYMGFAGDKLQSELEHNISQGFPEFVLKHDAEFNGQKMNTLLHFKKSDQSENYFFNKYNAELKHPDNKEEDRTHTFYLHKGNTITIKEAFNLLNGRAVNKDFVNKENQEYNAWVQFDLSQKENGNYKINQFHQNYGYNLQDEVKNLTLKSMPEELEKQLLSSLMKGNIQSVTMMKGDIEVKMYIEANPQYKTINIYDGKMKPLDLEAKKDFQHQQPQHGQNKQETKEESVISKKDHVQKADRNDGNNDDGPELKKKRTKHNKGMSV